MQGPDRHVRAAVKFQLDTAKAHLDNLDKEIQYEISLHNNRLADRQQTAEQVAELEKFLLDADLVEQQETGRVAEWRPDAPRGPRSDAW